MIKPLFYYSYVGELHLKGILSLPHSNSNQMLIYDRWQATIPKAHRHHDIAANQ